MWYKWQKTAFGSGLSLVGPHMIYHLMGGLDPLVPPPFLLAQGSWKGEKGKKGQCNLNSLFSKIKVARRRVKDEKQDKER